MHRILLMISRMLEMEITDVEFKPQTYYQKLYSFLDINNPCLKNPPRQNFLSRIAFILIVLSAKEDRQQCDFHALGFSHRF